MPGLLPIVMEGAGSRFTEAQRIATFQNATDAQLLALGVTPGDLNSIRTAIDENPENGAKAINEAFTRLDPNSVIAQEALQEIRIDHQTRLYVVFRRRGGSIPPSQQSRSIRAATLMLLPVMSSQIRLDRLHAARVRT
jgi:uncharacterized protein with PhoU and TrkA domain